MSTQQDRELEVALAAYYDQEAAERADRELDPRRVAARTAFIEVLRGESRTRVLEVGTGPGRDAQALVGAGLDVFGVDLSSEHVRMCRAHGARPVVGSATRLPFADEAFEALWSMSTLMHIPTRTIEVALRDLRRVLVPGGLAIIGVWGGSDHERHGVNERYDPPRLFSTRSEQTWRSLLEGGFTIDEYEVWSVDEAESGYHLTRLRAK